MSALEFQGWLITIFGVLFAICGLIFMVLCLIGLYKSMGRAFK